MNITHTYDDKKGLFTLLDGDKAVGTLEWTWTPGFEVSIDHVKVEEDARGDGAGAKLVAAAVQFARENALKVIAKCSYAQKVFESEESYRDVLAG